MECIDWCSRIGNCYLYLLLASIDADIDLGTRRGMLNRILQQISQCPSEQCGFYL